MYIYVENTWRSVGLVFMCVCVRAYYYNSVLCYCPLRQLFTLPLSIRVHPTETQYSGEKRPASTSSKKGSITRGKPTFHTHESVCVMSLLIFLKIEVVRSILFTFNLIFKHYFRPFGGLMKDLHFYILKFIVVFF